MALVSTAYIFVNFNALLNRAGWYTGMDTIIGFILILAVLGGDKTYIRSAASGIGGYLSLYGHHFGKYLPIFPSRDDTGICTGRGYFGTTVSVCL